MKNQFHLSQGFVGLQKNEITALLEAYDGKRPRQKYPQKKYEKGVFRAFIDGAAIKELRKFHNSLPDGAIENESILALFDIYFKQVRKTQKGHASYYIFEELDILLRNFLIDVYDYGVLDDQPIDARLKMLAICGKHNLLTEDIYSRVSGLNHLTPEQNRDCVTALKDLCFLTKGFIIRRGFWGSSYAKMHDEIKLQYINALFNNLQHISGIKNAFSALKDLRLDDMCASQILESNFLLRILKEAQYAQTMSDIIRGIISNLPSTFPFYDPYIDHYKEEQDYIKTRLSPQNTQNLFHAIETHPQSIEVIKSAYTQGWHALLVPMHCELIQTHPEEIKTLGFELDFLASSLKKTPLINLINQKNLNYIRQNHQDIRDYIKAQGFGKAGAKHFLAELESALYRNHQKLTPEHLFDVLQYILKMTCRIKEGDKLDSPVHGMFYNFYFSRIEHSTPTVRYILSQFEQMNILDRKHIQLCLAYPRNWRLIIKALNILQTHNLMAFEASLVCMMNERAFLKSEEMLRALETLAEAQVLDGYILEMLLEDPDAAKIIARSASLLAKQGMHELITPLVLKMIGHIQTYDAPLVAHHINDILQRTCQAIKFKYHDLFIPKHVNERPGQYVPQFNSSSASCRVEALENIFLFFYFKQCFYYQRCDVLSSDKKLRAISPLFNNLIMSIIDSKPNEIVKIIRALLKSGHDLTLRTDYIFDPILLFCSEVKNTSFQAPQPLRGVFIEDKFKIQPYHIINALQSLQKWGDALEDNDVMRVVQPFFLEPHRYIQGFSGDQQIELIQKLETMDDHFPPKHLLLASIYSGHVWGLPPEFAIEGVFSPSEELTNEKLVERMGDLARAQLEKIIQNKNLPNHSFWYKHALFIQYHLDLRDPRPERVSQRAISLYNLRHQNDSEGKKLFNRYWSFQDNQRASKTYHTEIIAQNLRKASFESFGF